MPWRAPWPAVAYASAARAGGKAFWTGTRKHPWEDSSEAASYHDLGHGYHQARSDSRHHKRDLIRRLERLTGQTVTLQPAAGQEPAA